VRLATLAGVVQMVGDDGGDSATEAEECGKGDIWRVKRVGVMARRPSHGLGLPPDHFPIAKTGAFSRLSKRRRKIEVHHLALNSKRQRQWKHPRIHHFRIPFFLLWCITLLGKPEATMDSDLVGSV
jgi:hypothetical protein